MTVRRILSALAVCAAAAAMLTAEAAAAGSKTLESNVVIGGAFGSGDDGVIAGAVTAEKSSCVAGRHVRLTGDGKVLDKAVTTKHGAWGLHVTEAEDASIDKYKVTVKASVLKNGDACGADSTLYAE